MQNKIHALFYIHYLPSYFSLWILLGVEVNICTVIFHCIYQIRYIFSLHWTYQVTLSKKPFLTNLILGRREIEQSYNDRTVFSLSSTMYMTLSCSLNSCGIYIIINCLILWQIRNKYRFTYCLRINWGNLLLTSKVSNKFMVCVYR